MNFDKKGISTNVIAVAVVAILVVAGVAIVLTQGVGHIVTYDSNGGTPVEGRVDPYTVSETNFEELDLLFEKTGYTIIQWNTAKDGSGTSYMPGDEVTADCTVYAIWKAGVPMLYDGNGGKTSDDATSVRVVETYVSFNMFSNPGFYFSGWNTAKDGSGTQYVPFSPAVDGKTVYAQWVKNIDSDDGSKYSFDASKQLKICTDALSGSLKGNYVVKGNALSASADHVDGSGNILHQATTSIFSDVSYATEHYDSAIKTLKASGAYTVTEVSVPWADKCAKVVMNVQSYKLNCLIVVISNVELTLMDGTASLSQDVLINGMQEMISSMPTV